VDAEGQDGASLPDEMDAKVDIFFLVLTEEHDGQGTPLSSPMRRISEKSLPQSAHLNSYIGMK
jgi:hypothetical protein